MILQDTTHQFDVAILGSGLSGSLLGAILAKLGASVVLLDGEVHPRFAVGESTIPHTSLLLSLLAEKYGLPEIENLAYPDRLARHVCTSCGIKRAFGFAHHEPGQPYDARRGHQFGTNMKDENHWFRQDIDAYLFQLAIHYGAVPRQRTMVKDLSIDQHGVLLTTSTGEGIKARFVVDGTGFRSVLAEKFDLREKPTRLKHHSRSLFTHMVDVPPFQEDRNPLSLSWHQNTLHHCFERGWFWVIPFNNHAASTNPLISIGLTMDERKYPKPADLTPEQEFQQFLSRFPSVDEQLSGARAVRPWVSTARLQYSSRNSTGYRYCLMSHAAGFIDPLYSRGMINTLEVISALVDPLMNALASDDFDPRAFEHIDRLQQKVIDYADNLANGSFIAWSNFELWNAFVRVWALGTIPTEFRLINALENYTRTRDEKYFAGDVEDCAFSPFEAPDYKPFYDGSIATIEAYERGELRAGEAADCIFKLAESHDMSVLLRVEALRRAGWLQDGETLSDKQLQMARRGYRWALASPVTRDLFGNYENFFRWCRRDPDPHLTACRRAPSPEPARGPDSQPRRDARSPASPNISKIKRQRNNPLPRDW
jgi:FADH2 O2-dependent halogenase